jgi:hypothetical protein
MKRTYFVYEVSMEFSSPYDRKQRNDEYHEYCRTHPSGGMCVRWLEEHPDKSTRQVEKLIAVDNPLGDGISDKIIRQVIGEPENIGDWYVVIKSAKLIGDVEVEEGSK